ncbi:MAG: ATP-dependent helicase [Candidatus Omnitrophica bacterium]|nr:ATP-dependent helicase [Candidatus Omnitrophota bacterium]
MKPLDLNDAQWQAVSHQGSHLMIVAGPGTGKTHTITYRIVRFINELNVGAGLRPALNDVRVGLEPTPTDQRILAITFTNKAAKELQERLEAKLPEFWRLATVGTFHRFALGLLREFSDATPLPKDFQIALPEEISALLEEIFPKKTTLERKETLERISLIKATQLVIDPDSDYQTYHRFLRAKNWIDFDDILRETLLLLENEEILAKVQERYRYIFVDEYQDVNLIQNTLLKTLVSEGVLLTVIGDPNQSIYGFRGSQVKFFTRFEEDFPGAAKLYLTENYRSKSNLLSASSQVIAKSPSTDVPEIIAKIFDEGRLVIHEAATDRAEAEYVVHQIEQMVGGVSMLSLDSHRVSSYNQAQRSFGDIAILYRLNAQKNVVMGALDHLGIPYSVSAKSKIKKEELEGVTQETKDEILLQQHEEFVDYNVEKVSLLTMHAAKGLEFPVVFMIGCEEKLLPLNLDTMKGDSEEERRLFYVGMTRAKEQLFLTRAGRRQLYGQTFFNAPSMFLSDIQEDLKAYENSKIRKKINKSKASDNQQLKLF